MASKITEISVLKEIERVSSGAGSSNDQSTWLQEQSTALQKQHTRSYASVVAAATPDTESKSEPEQPIGPIERSRLQRLKKPGDYYWPSWQDLPAREELPAPLQSPSQEIAIPEIIISEPANSPLSSCSLAPPQRMDASKLTPRTAPRAKVLRKRDDGNERINVPWRDYYGEIAPKPSLFSYNICTHPRCPISSVHDKGYFLHGKRNTYWLEVRQNGRMPFGPNNPPPEVWEAYYRVMSPGGGCAGDVETVEGFKAAHWEPVRVVQGEDSDDGEFWDEDSDVLELEDERFVHDME